MTTFVGLLEQFEKTTANTQQYERKLNLFLFDKIQELEKEITELKQNQESLMYRMDFLIDEAGDIKAQLRIDK